MSEMMNEWIEDTPVGVKVATPFLMALFVLLIVVLFYKNAFLGVLVIGVVLSFLRIDHYITHGK
jgi:hypothetical protein